MKYIIGGSQQDQGTCSSQDDCKHLEENDESSLKEPSAGLALQPIQSDLLSLNIRPAGGPDYNIHELPSLDGKAFNSGLYEKPYEFYKSYKSFNLTHYLQETIVYDSCFQIAHVFNDIRIRSRASKP